MTDLEITPQWRPRSTAPAPARGMVIRARVGRWAPYTLHGTGSEWRQVEYSAVGDRFTHWQEASTK